MPRNMQICNIISEREYQSALIHKLRDKFPGSIVLKNSPENYQGFPDILILYGNNWAALEIKRNASAVHQPNQYYYVKLLKSMSYAAFIYPENEEEVLLELERALIS